MNLMLPRVLLPVASLVLSLTAGAPALALKNKPAPMTPDLTAQSADRRSRIEATPCPFASEALETDVVCGVLEVPEDYDGTSTRRVSLPFVTVKPLVDPLDSPPLVIAGGGGPGAALGIGPDDSFVELEIWKNWRYSTVDAGRDLVLIDNRGAGASTPSLFCPEVHEEFERTLAVTRTAQSDIEQARDMLDAYRDCRRRIESHGTDLSHYNVINAARDLEQLRLLLGHASLDLFGASYGSRVAMMYERLFPRATRTLTLDGAYPFTEYGLQHDWIVFADTFDRIFRLCRSNARCANALGAELEADFHAYLGTLQHRPVTVSVTSSDPIAEVRISVTPAVLTTALFSAAYDAGTLAQLPFMMRAIVSGGTDYLTELVRDYYYQGSLDTSFNDAAYYAYACHDSLPFTDFEHLSAQFGKQWFAPYFHAELSVFSPAVCSALGIDPADARIIEAQEISAPVLILAGKLDPVTPLAWSRTLAQRTDEAWLITFGDIGHYVIGSNWWCADTVLEHFLADPHSPPEDECLTGAAARTVEPVTNLSGY